MRRVFIAVFIVMAFARCTANGAQVVLKSIALKPDTVKIIRGNSMQLIPVFTPSTFSGIAVNWSTTDAASATVSPTGLLYAVNPGTATITIKDKNSATTGKCFVIIQ